MEEDETETDTKPPVVEAGVSDHDAVRAAVEGHAPELFSAHLGEVRP